MLKGHAPKKSVMPPILPLSPSPSVTWKVQYYDKNAYSKFFNYHTYSPCIFKISFFRLATSWWCSYKSSLSTLIILQFFPLVILVGWFFMLALLSIILSSSQLSNFPFFNTFSFSIFCLIILISSKSLFLFGKCCHLWSQWHGINLLLPRNKTIILSLFPSNM